MNKKPKVGQIVFEKVDGKLEPLEVTKVGRKYFYCQTASQIEYGQKPGIDNAFEIATWRGSADHYRSSKTVYESKQAHRDEVLWNDLRVEFNYLFERSCHGLSLDQLKRIKTIIEEGKNA